MITNTLVTEKNSLLWKRLIAFLFDFFLVGLTTLVIYMLSPKPIPALLSKWVLFAVFMTYSILFDYYQHGTPGKHIMKIKILYTYDKRSYLLTIFYRDFLKAIFFFEVFWLLTPYRQGLHNKIAKCLIVENVTTTQTNENGKINDY
jgi:uncharacterized RDD family membrane protein YckC